MAASKGISKIKGHSGSSAYPQPEGNLAEVMLRFGPEFGPQSAYGELSLILVALINSLVLKLHL